VSSVHSFAFFSCLGIFWSTFLFLCHWISFVFFLYDWIICTLLLDPSLPHSWAWNSLSDHFNRNWCRKLEMIAVFTYRVSSSVLLPVLWSIFPPDAVWYHKKEKVWGSIVWLYDFQLSPRDERNCITRVCLGLLIQLWYSGCQWLSRIVTLV